VLATFRAAVLVRILAPHAEFYGASGKTVVVLFTIVLIGLVLVALIWWIRDCMWFGQLSD